MIFLPEIRNALIVAIAASVIGFGAGYATKAKFDKADALTKMVEVRHEDAATVQQSVQASASIEKQAGAATQNVETIRQQVAQRLRQPPIKDEHHEDATQECPAWTLDVGTVRLLDAARAGTPPDPSGLGDDESKAPSAVGAAAFIDNDLQVIELYHDLATRHDALVDYVESIINKQAK